MYSSKRSISNSVCGNIGSMLKRSAAVLLMLIMTAATAWATQPDRCLDECMGGASLIHVQGWAYDPDAPSQSIDVHVYVYTDAGCTSQYGDVHVLTANVSRPDVNEAKGITGNHGFNADISIADAGNYWVKIFAIDTGGDGNPQIGAMTAVTVTETEQVLMVGSLEVCTGGAGYIHVEGWAYVPDFSSETLEMSVYVYTDADCTNLYDAQGIIDLLTTNVPRPDVNSANGITGDHGFNFYFPIADAGNYWVKIFGGIFQVGSTMAVTVTAAAPPSDNAKTLPYTYGFENNDLTAEGWTIVDGSMSTSISDTNPYSGIYSLVVQSDDPSNYSGCQYLISPEIINSGYDEIEIYFFKYTPYDIYFDCGYSTTINSLDAFTWIGEGLQTNSEWSHYSDFFPANTKYIAIKCRFTEGAVSGSLDDFAFFARGSNPPYFLEASNITYQSVTLTWTTFGVATGYAYQYKKSSDANWSEEVTTTSTSIELTGLIDETSYDFRVKAFYDSDISLYSTISFVARNPAPTDLTVTETTDRSVTLAWEAPETEQPLTHYGYQIRKQNDENWSAVMTTNGTTATIEGLFTGTPYDFRVRAYYEGNHTSVLVSKKFTTESLPLVLADVKEQTATLTWVPTTPNPAIIDYIYQYKKVGESTWSDEVITSETSADISGLLADTDYEFRIKALYADGESPYITSSFATCKSLPYEQGFENGYDRWTWVDCFFHWDETIYDIWGTGRRADAAHDSDISFKFFWYDEEHKKPQYLISPCFAGDAAITMSFYYRILTNIDETIYVGYSTTTNDKEAFTFGDSITVSSSNWTKYENTFPIGTRYIAIKYTSNRYIMYLDDFCFEELSTYAKPDSIGLTELAVTKAMVIWNIPNEAVKSFVYQYKKPNEATWSAETTIYANYVTLENLTPNTFYNFRVKAIYDGNHASNYATCNFQTDASVVDLPYTDGFENGMGGWRMLDCSGTTRVLKTEGFHSGSYCFMFWTSNQHQYLISPHFAGGVPMKVSFYYTNLENHPAALHVGYASSKYSDFTWVVDYAIIASDAAWHLYETTVPAEAQYVVICCRKEGYILILDDFTFTGIPDVVFADDADNTTTITNHSGEKVVAALQGRTLYRDGDWNTLTLPFNVSGFDGTPLEGATVKTLSSSALSDGTLTLNFEDVTEIEAGKPYIVKWNEGLNLTINSTADWNDFAESVNGGKSYAGKTVLLGADINVSTMVGTADCPFSGTFEGAGHTLNVSISDGGDGAAPFRYVSGATIRNVKTTGTVSGGNHCAGLVGIAPGGTNSIRDCYVAASVSGGSYAGGILGNGTTSTTTISNSLFGGSLSAYNMGILYGWGEDGGTHTVENCVVFGTYADVSVVIGGGESGSIDLLLGNGTKTVTKCWKSTEVGSQGVYGFVIYSGGEHPLVTNYLGSQWTYENNDFVLSPMVNIIDTNIESPMFLGVTVSDAPAASVDFTGGQFVGTYSPLASTAGLLFDAHNPDNGACRAALSITEPTREGYTFGGWYTDMGLTVPATSIPFAGDGTVKLYAKWIRNTVVLTALDSGSSVAELENNWAGKTVDVSFTRAFTQGVASTICLPYPMTGIDGGSVYEFRDVSYDASANNGAGAWVATMVDETPDGNKVTATVAGKPYLFMPSATAGVTFTGTVVVPENVTAGTSTSTSSANDGTWTFRGTYRRLAYKADGTADLDGSVFGFAASSDEVDGKMVYAGEFVKAKDGAGVPAFRAYLTYQGTNNVFSAMTRDGAGDTCSEIPDRITVRLLGKDGTLTAVGTMDTSTGDVRIEQWFDMLGRPIDGTPSLPGMYMNSSGSKVMIK